MVDGEPQMNYCGRLQMKSSGGLPQSRTVVSFRWRTTALGYRRGTTVVSLKWRTISLGNRQRTTLVGFKWQLNFSYGRLAAGEEL